eukprot:421244-Amphidinium_carterae.1
MMGRQEKTLREDELQELCIMLTERSLRQWTTIGAVPSQEYEDGTDDRHGTYNLHKQRAINDFINLYLQN